MPLRHCSIERRASFCQTQFYSGFFTFFNAMFIMTLGPIETADSLVLKGAGIDVACSKSTNLMKK